MISFLGNWRLGISVALHAIRYPYSTLRTLSCAMMSKSFCSLSSSRMTGSSLTARSWYDWESQRKATIEMLGY